AVTLMMEKDAVRGMELLGKIQKLEDDGEPITPLILHGVKVNPGNSRLLASELTTLSHIARNDLQAYKVVASGLANQHEEVRLAALEALSRMKHGNLAVPTILRLLKADSAEIREASIAALTELAEESTEEQITEAIATQRYHDK